MGWKSARIIPAVVRKYLRVQITTGDTPLSFAMFGNVHLHKRCLKPGNVLMFYGKLGLFRNKWELKNVSYVSVFVHSESEFGAFEPLKTVVDIAGSERKAMEILNRPWLPFYPRRVGMHDRRNAGGDEYVLACMGIPPRYCRARGRDVMRPNGRSMSTGRHCWISPPHCARFTSHPWRWSLRGLV